MLKNYSTTQTLRIIIGPIIIIASVLAFFVSVWFAVVPTLIGIGLTRAGIMNSCPLENVIKYFKEN